MSEEQLYGPLGTLREKLALTGTRGWSGLQFMVAGRQRVWSAQVYLFGADKLGDIYSTKLPSWDCSDALKPFYDNAEAMMRDAGLVLDEYGQGLHRYLYRA